MTEQKQWPKPDKERLKKAAIVLRQALITFRDNNSHGWGDLAAEILESMTHEFEFAIAGKIETPFDVGWGKVFGDQLSFPELWNVYVEYVRAARADMESEEFWQSPFYNRYLLRDGTLSDRGRPGVRSQ